MRAAAIPTAIPATIWLALLPEAAPLKGVRVGEVMFETTTEVGAWGCPSVNSDTGAGWVVTVATGARVVAA